MLVIPLVLWASIPGQYSIDQRLALLYLCIGVLIALFGGLSEAVFKSTERYALGAILSNFVRLAEWLGYMIGLALVGSFAAVAATGLIARFLGTIISIVLAGKGRYGLNWGLVAADREEIRSMVKPAISFMAFPLANALSFQGITLTVGAIFGPVAVAIFSTYRTIARIAVQVTAIFSHVLWPEFSRLFGQGATIEVNRLYHRAFKLSATQSVGLSLLLYVISPWLLKVWAHGAIKFVPSLMLLMLLYATVGGIWHIPRVLLMATNQHVGLAYWVLASGVLSVLSAWMLSTVFQLNGVAIAMLISEFFIAIVCIWLAHRLKSETLRGEVALQ
jgi:O-antigen/teichoic acid export membrane protein